MVLYGRLDRYIGRSILGTTLVVLLTLVAIAAVFAFIAELEDVGQGQYSAWNALQYVLLMSPSNAYMLFAPAVLLGSLLGLGALAGNSELTVMRAAGVSIARIVRAVLVTGLALMVLVAVVGETIMPRTEHIAEQLRLTALEKRLSVRGRSGLWLRSGDWYVNVSTVLPDFTLLDVTLKRFEKNRLAETIQATRAIQDGDDWRLEDVYRVRFGVEKLSPQHLPVQSWRALQGESVPESALNLVNTEVLQSLSTSTDSLSVRALLGQVRYLRENGLESRGVELALWVKLLSPMASLVMLMLSLPFVFGSQRGGGAGQRIFLGILLGIAYVLLSRLFTQMGLANGLSPWLSAVLPLLFFFIVSLVGLQRTARLD